MILDFYVHLVLTRNSILPWAYWFTWIQLGCFLCIRTFLSSPSCVHCTTRYPWLSCVSTRSPWSSCSLLAWSTFAYWKKILQFRTVKKSFLNKAIKISWSTADKSETICKIISVESVRCLWNLLQRTDYFWIVYFYVCTVYLLQQIFDRHLKICSQNLTESVLLFRLFILKINISYPPSQRHAHHVL